MVRGCSTHPPDWETTQKSACDNFTKRNKIWKLAKETCWKRKFSGYILKRTKQASALNSTVAKYQKRSNIPCRAQEFHFLFRSINLDVIDLFHVFHNFLFCVLGPFVGKIRIYCIIRWSSKIKICFFFCAQRSDRAIKNWNWLRATYTETPLHRFFSVQQKAGRFVRCALHAEGRKVLHLSGVSGSKRNDKD